MGNFFRVAKNLGSEELCPFQNFVPSAAMMGHFSQTNACNIIEKDLNSAATVKKLF
jgi:hypothetical protein